MGGGGADGAGPMKTTGHVKTESTGAVCCSPLGLNI